MTVPKILIVDDEAFNVDYLEQELEESHYETISAANGRDALAAVESDPPDLILLDIMMPVMDGFEVLKRLKENQATRDIPVIIISADSNLQNVAKGIQMGAEDYLPKPFEPTILHARVSSCLEKKHLHDLETIYLKGLERELDIAREIQMGFLPTELPALEGWDISAYFKAAHEVAGDFYDAFTLPDGKLICVVGDVCGKGVGAALFMTLFRSLIRASATTGDFSTGDCVSNLSSPDRLKHVVSSTNAYVARTHADANMFATVFICLIDLQNGKLDYINCGNESPLLIRNGILVTSLPPTGPVIGIFAEAEFSTGEVSMGKDDLLLACTDGITDALNAAGESFGNERILKLLTEGGSSPQALLRHIEQQLQHHIGNADQFDDITILAVKRGV